MFKHLMRSFDTSTSACIYVYINPFSTLYSHPNTHFLIKTLHPSNLYLVNQSSPPTKMKTKFIKSCQKKLKKMTVTTPCKFCERICLAFKRGAEVIPKDVPKGHLVVYVGEESRRFVIKISLLTHPLFKALLDQAQDAYGFSADSRLWIPCDVSTFLHVVRCAGAPRRQNKCMCI